MEPEPFFLVFHVRLDPQSCGTDWGLGGGGGSALHVNWAYAQSESSVGGRGSLEEVV